MERLIKAREDAMANVRAWWDAQASSGNYRYVTDAPMWKNYLAACAALDQAREAEG